MRPALPAELVFRLLISFSALVIAGCGDGGTAPPQPEVMVPGQLEPAALLSVATVGTTLVGPTVTLRDTKGRPLAGAAVNFLVTAGGGAIERNTASTGTDGSASAGSWVLGARPGENQLEARAQGVAPVTFSVVANVGPATSLTAHSSNPARGVVGQLLDPMPAVVVQDALGNPVPGVGVSFVAGEGSGSVAQGSAATDTNGIARAAWTLGTVSRVQTLRATLGSLTVTLGVDVAAGAAAAAEATAGNGQSATVGTAVAVPPAVQLRDAFGNAVAGVAVQFAVTSGEGQVTGGNVTTDATGTARVGAWTLGTRAGANGVSASVAGIPPVTFAATGTPAPPRALAKAAGDGQTAPAGQLVPVPPAVSVSDTFGNPVPNVQVTFSASAGVLTGSTALTDAAGVARLEAWRLGNASGVQTVEARVGTLVASFSATATVGPPAVLQLVAGEGQAVPAGTTVPVRPAVRVRDAIGNNLAGIPVRFSLGIGGGVVSGGSAVTGPDGVATVGGWTLGTAAGVNRLTATVDGLASVSFTATGLTGPAAQVIRAAGDGQSVAAGTAVPIPPTVRVLDRFDNPVRDVTVSFTPSAGGRVTGENRTTATDGTASVGEWQLADDPGINTLTATVAGVGHVNFTATGASITVPTTPFQIELRYLSAVTPVQRQAFEAAAGRWQELITADLPDYNLNIPAGVCTGSPAVNEIVDDLLIFVQLEAIDGPGSTLGSAGPRYIRPAGLPLLGCMRFDTADLTALELNGRLEDVILHELGHVLGIGTLWSVRSLLQGEGGADPYFTGSGASQRFVLAGGNIPPGYGVPVENTGGSGTRDSHWRETTLGTELMTGWLSSGSANPLSAITAASLADLGYTINLAAADPFTVPSALGYELETSAFRLVELPMPPPRVAY